MNDSHDIPPPTENCKHKSLAAAAAELAAQGLPIFPCLANKRPATAHGFKDAVTDPDAARRLFLDTSGAALIGMPTGPASGLSVVDIDPQAVLWLRQNWRLLPDTREHKTPRGGYHLLFKHSEGLRNSAGKIRGAVDIRGEGGYVIMPPSPGYTVVHDGPLLDFPKWILRRLARQSKKDTVIDKIRDGPADIARLADFVGRSRPGERNARLFWAACRLGEKGAGAAQGMLVQAALGCGLDPVEAWQTVNSGIQSGKRGHE